MKIGLLLSMISVVAASPSLSSISNAIDIQREAQEEAFITISKNLATGSTWSQGIYSSGSLPSEPPTPMFIDSNTYDQVMLTRNVLRIGEDAIGSTLYNLPFEEDYQYTGIQENVHYDVSNLNLIFKDHQKQDIVLSYGKATMVNLANIAIHKNVTYTLPAFVFDDESVAYFRFSPDSFEFIARKDIFEYAAIYSISNPGDMYQFHFTIKADIYNKIEEVGTFSTDSYYTDSSDMGSYYGIDYDLGFIPGLNQNGVKDSRALAAWIPIGGNTWSTFYDRGGRFLPFDITYFNPSTGQINIGHDQQMMMYGRSTSHYELESITFYIERINRTFTANRFTEAQYELYGDSHDEAASEIGNDFYLGPRPREEFEIGGSGGLIWSYCMPYSREWADLTMSAVVIKEFTWSYFKIAEDSGCGYTQASTFPVTTKTQPNDNAKTSTNIDTIHKNNIAYNYYNQLAVGKCYFNTFELNMNTSEDSPYTVDVQHLSINTSSWEFWVLTVLTAGVYAVPTIGMITFLNWFEDLTQTQNVQRFYFNVFDSQNQLLPNIQKLEFSYQLGGKEFRKTHDPEKPVYHDEWKVASREELIRETVEPASLHTIKISKQMDGFASIYDEPDTLRGVEYHWFYQNIYETDTNKDPTWSEFISFWNPLSVWYEVPDGYVVRLTTNKNGNVMVQDEDGDWVVVDETGTPTGETPEEYMTDVENTNNDYENTEDAEAVGISSEWWKDFWSNYGSSIKKALIIVGIILGAALIIFVVVKLAPYFKGLASSIRAKKAKKKYRSNKRKYSSYRRRK